MIARIKKDETTYDTVVFAVLSDGWYSKIIGFDETFETLEYINIYGSVTPYIKQQIFFIDSSDDEWSTKGKISGFSWIINNTLLLKLLEQDRYIPDEILSRCIEIQKNTIIPEWFEVLDEKSAKNLLVASECFHDAIIETVKTENSETFITIKIWEAKIHLKLKDANLSSNCKVGYGNLGEIYDSSIFFEDGRIFWTDCDGANSKNSLRNASCFFSATKMLWKLD
ncbi:MAG: hypothetical protein E7612_07515 [Ruminococcaceae bacterium]|nr:hypothetical protein [Oscillospiraceae bacterium]